MQRSGACKGHGVACQRRWPERPSECESRGQHEGRTVQPASLPKIIVTPPESTPVSRSPDRLIPVVKDLEQRGLVPPGKYAVELGDAKLRINYPSEHWCFPQEAVPSPESRPDLLHDDVLGGSLQQPGGLEIIRTFLTKRRKATDAGQPESFTFPPLETTLCNMKIFVRHLREGKHFSQEHPLTAGDHKALDWLEERADALLNAGVPYTLTVHLAFAFLAVYEVMVGKRVAVPLKPDGTARWRYALADLAAEDVIAYSWGGNNTTGSKSGEEFGQHFRKGEGLDALTDFLHRPHLLMYPSFQPLGVGDFCKFGHLPVHPIGMLPDYACNADGFVLSPWEFAGHDVFHMRQQGSVGTPCDQAPTPATRVMRSPGHRFALGQLLLRQMPASLAGLDLQPGLQLLQFSLFHEMGPREAAEVLEDSFCCFPRCLEAVLHILRSDRAGYLPEDISVTDAEATRAAFWAARLLNHWREGGWQPLTQEQCDACGVAFVEKDLPLLDQHLDFIACHRGALRLLFMERYGVRAAHPPDEESCRITTRLLSRLGLSRRISYIVFESFNPYAGLCNTDNTDLCYFAALTSEKLRCEMEEWTNARLPEAVVPVAHRQESQTRVS
ncbi:MAG: hypothetical protein OXC07_07610 [Kistimonas sp.]|nr:hypothetical protein [Kistimonas sp.]